MTMNNYQFIFYILIGIILAAIVEYAYDRRRAGDIDFQFEGPDINWMSRLLTITLWPVVITITIVMIIRSIIDKFNKDKNKH